MTKNLDELKMIVDLAKTGGMMEAQNKMMEEQLQEKDEEIARQKEMLKERSYSSTSCSTYSKPSVTC